MQDDAGHERNLMNFSQLFAFKKNFKYIAWFFWFIFFINALLRIYSPFVSSTENIQKADYLDMLIPALIIAALIEAIGTILIRYFALIRPSKKGTYNPYFGPLRFFLVGIINWILSGGIVVYGTVIFFLSGETWPVLLFGVTGILLLIFHSPRLGPFIKEPNQKEGIIDTPFSKVT